MHELAVTQRIVDTVIAHGVKSKAKRVHRVLLVVSELSDMQPLWLQRYFDRLAHGTIAEGARLEIEAEAPEFSCNKCGAQFAVSLRGVDRVECTECGSPDCTLMSEAHYVIEEIEVS